MNAILAGASGLTGGCLARELADHPGVRVTALVRKPVAGLPAAIEQTACDFDRLDTLPPTPAYAVFCALGTTISKAGSREAFRRVDYDAVLAVGRYGRRCGARQFLLVSSVGASAASSTFYLRVKGEAERDLAGLGFEAMHIFRPSLLLGTRTEKRLGETLSTPMVKAIGWALVGPLEKYRGIPSATVAKSMVTMTARPEANGVGIYHYREMVEMAARA